MLELNCPYCQNPFPKFPERKIKCKVCNNYVIPKRRPEDPANVKTLLTEPQAEEVERAWNGIHALNQLRESLKATGVSYEQLERLFPAGTAPEDVVYNGLRHVLREYLIDDLNARAFAYHLLGNLAWKRNDKDSSTQFHRHGYANRAKGIGTRVAVLKLMLQAGPRACAECQKVAGPVEIDEYAQKPLLPLSTCAELERTKGQGCLMLLPHSEGWS